MISGHLYDLRYFGTKGAFLCFLGTLPRRGQEVNRGFYTSKFAQIYLRKTLPLEALKNRKEEGK
jgi:hypothetical protein